MLGLLALAVAVQLFGDGPDAGLLCVGGGGEGEGLEAGRFDVDRVDFRRRVLPAASAQVTWMRLESTPRK